MCLDLRSSATIQSSFLLPKTFWEDNIKIIKLNEHLQSTELLGDITVGTYQPHVRLVNYNF